METITEKKWFVYVGDHHEGPFLDDEVRDRFKNGLITQGTFVWKEGMSDWRRLHEVPELRDILQEPSLTETPSGSTDEESSLNHAEAEISHTSETVPHVDEAGGDTNSDSSTLIIERPAEQVEIQQASQPVLRRRTKIPQIVVGLFLITIGTWLFAMIRLEKDPRFMSAVPAVQKALFASTEWSSRIPLLSSWFSSIPLLSDVTTEEFEQLKMASRSGSAGTPRMSLALSQENSLSPHFYLAGGFPDETRFVVGIVGIPETLLNHLAFQEQFQVTLQRQFAKTPPLTFKNNQPIPKGEYIVYVGTKEPVNSAWIIPLDQLPIQIPQGLAVLVFKKYFLGGPKDDTYLARLKDFHEMVRTRAAHEMSELKQMISTLGSQLDSTQKEYDLVRQNKFAPKYRKAWENFHTGWIGLTTQLNGVFNKWTADSSQNEYFYGRIYQLTRNVGKRIAELHELQNARVAGQNDSARLSNASPAASLREGEERINQASQAAQDSLAQAKDSLDSAEKNALSATQLPPREGF